MATKRGGGKAKSEARAKTGKRSPKPNKGGLRDLEAKNAKAVRGGTFCATGKHYDKAIIIS